MLQRTKLLYSPSEKRCFRLSLWWWSSLSRSDAPTQAYVQQRGPCLWPESVGGHEDVWCRPFVTYHILFPTVMVFQTPSSSIMQRLCLSLRRTSYLNITSESVRRITYALDSSWHLLEHIAEILEEELQPLKKNHCIVHPTLVNLILNTNCKVKTKKGPKIQKFKNK